MKEKSIELLTAVVEFLNSALLYYNQKFFGLSTLLSLADDNR